MRKSFFDPKLLLKIASKFYFLVKEAAPLSEIIQSLDLESEILEFLDTIPNDKKGFYVSELRKNPKMNLDELQNLELKKKISPQILPQEIRIVQNFPNKEWALIQLRKLRQNKIPPKEVFDHIFVDPDIEVPSEFETYTNLGLEIETHLLEDWINAENPQLASYTGEEAMEASFDWHSETAQKGAGQKYQEGNSNIVYGPNWENPKFNGWTIRKITTKNDLEVEGYKINHCVGSYCEWVDLGESAIYSLRDPSNEPHVTMEAKGNSFNFKQIVGHSNSNPKPMYKEMIKEWFQKLKKSGKHVSSANEYLNVWSLNSDWEKAKKQIDEVMDENEYGLKHTPFNENINVNDFYAKFLNFAFHAPNNLDEITDKFTQIMHEKDKNLYEKINHQPEQFKLINWSRLSIIGKFKDIMNDKQLTYKEEFKQYEDSLTPPDSNDYDQGNNDKKYIHDYEIWINEKEKMKQDYHNELSESISYKFDKTLIDKIKKYQTIDPIPAESWMRDDNYDNL